MTHPVRHSAFSDNLGNDVLAVDALGNILCRSSNEESARKAAPNADAYLTAKDLDSAEALPAAAAASQEPALDQIVAGVSPDVMKDYEAKTAVEATPTETKAELAPDADTKAAVDTPKDLKNAPKSQPKVADGSKFDHDRDGYVGGSRAKSKK